MVIVADCKSSKYLVKSVQFLPPATKLGQGYIFTGVCDSVHGGACMAGGMHGWEGGRHAWQEGGGCAWWGACVAGGHVWRGACMAGDMHGWEHVWQGACVWGACMGGHVWGVCMARVGMHGRGHVWQGGMARGACMAGGMCVAGGHAWQIL